MMFIRKINNINRNSLVAFVLLLMLTTIVPAIFAEEDIDKRNEKAPWLKGVTIGPHPQHMSPVLPLKIYDENGGTPLATLTEDVPVIFTADSTIFDEQPPTSYRGEEIQNPRWAAKLDVSWFFIDWEINKNTRAKSSDTGLAVNQVIVTPLSPTGKGAVTCYLARRMKYDDSEAGRSRGTYVNSSGAKDVRVLDITPPTCGLEISVKGGETGTFWTVENPPNKYPLPKLADVCFTGSLCLPGNQKDNVILSEVELGADMIISAEQAAVTVPADAIITLKVVGEDNYKLDNSKVKYGLCAGAGGEPNPVGDINPPTIDLSVLRIPKEPYLYVDASDVSGNRQVIFVPLKVE